MRRTHSILLLLLLWSSCVAAATEAKPRIGNDDEATYSACMAAARNAPEDGYELASTWLTQNGGEPAEHCQAVAMIGLKRYSEAGQRLEQLAAKLPADDTEMRAESLSQAAEAWSEDGRPARAESDLDQAIKLEPADLDYHIDRATARASQRNYTGAIEDLTSVIAGDPGRGEAYAYRAAAYRLSGDLKSARADADKAVDRSPTLPEAWLERANTRGLSGDTDGAKQDWEKVVTLAPDSAAGAAAQRNLQALASAEGKPTPAEEATSAAVAPEGK